ncbi:hypothetical protein FJNA_02370 [Thermus sp. FJN-A]
MVRLESALRCAVCQRRIPGLPLWVEVEGVRYPVEDEACARFLKEAPVAALGPRAELLYRPDCPACMVKVALWREAARHRPLRLRLRPVAGPPCPRLFLEGEEDPVTLEIKNLEELLLWLWVQYPGFYGCC